MNTKKNISKPIILYTALSLLALSLVALLLFKQEKIAYVDSVILYEKYDGKLELEHKLNLLIEKQEQILDSIKQQVLVLSDEYQINTSDNLKEQILVKQQNYNRLYEEFSKISQEQRNEYVTEVWDQINTHTQSYGEENGFKLILGANGNGSLMYAEAGDNITEEVLDFINKRYQGE